MATIDYDAAPEILSTMPNPEVFMEYMLNELAGAIKTAIDNGDANVTTAFTAADSALQNQINVLTNDTTLAERLAALTAIVDELDLSSNTLLLSIKETADTALAIATAAETNSDQALVDLAALKADYEAFKIAAGEQLGALNDSITANDTAISELTASLSMRILDLIHYNNTRFVAGLEAGLVSFKATLLGTSGDGDGGDIV